jgi:hypothetical protein
MNMAPPLTEGETGAVAVCRVVLERLVVALEEESKGLAARTMVRHGAFTERKNQLLRELIVAQRNVTLPTAIRALSVQTAAVQKALARNQQLLKDHISAGREVSAIIVDSIRQSESDGTYSRYS